MRNIPLEIENLPIYDQILHSMNFDFEQKQIEINIERYDETLQTYILLKVGFRGVFRFESEYPQDVLFKPHGCYRVESKEIGTDEYEAIWVFQINDQPLWTVKIGFREFYWEEPHGITAMVKEA